MNSETPETDAVVLSKDYVPFCGAPVVDIVPAKKMRQLELRNRRLVEALKFYADPQTYFAITMLPDPPCGEFVTDFEDVGELSGRQRPGKRARAALTDQQKEKR